MSDRDLSPTSIVSDPGPVLGPPFPEPDRPADAEVVAEAVPVTRRNRWTLVLGAVLVLVLVGAGALAYRAHRTDAEATRIRAAAVALDQQSDQLAQRADQANSAAAQLDTNIAAAQDGLGRVVSALDFATQMQNEYVDVLNRAADLHNSGHLSAAHDLLQGDGAAALAKFQDSVTALDHVLADAQAAAQDLQEANHV